MTKISSTPLRNPGVAITPEFYAAARELTDAFQEDLFALLNENNYEKGGWVLQMLRDLVGDEDFFEGVRT